MSGPIEITIKPPYRAVTGKFAKATKELKKDRRNALRQIGQKYVSVARQEAPKKSGKYRKSIRFRTGTQGDNIILTTSSAQPLGKWIIEGTKAHTIVAKAGKVLAFYWKKGFKGPGMYFFRSVRHPGTKPNPYHKRAWKRIKGFSNNMLRKLARDWVVKVQ